MANVASASSTVDKFEAGVNEDGKIVDFLTEEPLEPGPEEFVRQRYLRVLHYEYQYPKAWMGREVPIYYGTKEAKDGSGKPARADIVIYRDEKSRKKRDQGRIEVIVECKAPTLEAGHNQLVSYLFNTSANGAVWTNGSDARYFRRISTPKNDLIDWLGIPRLGQAWDSLGLIKKSDLARPKDIKGLLRLCHNKLHGRGHDGEDSDLTMDMVRIVLAKARDEEKPGDDPSFYCTPEEYGSEQGQAAVAARVQALFAEQVQANPDVFGPTERITVGPRTICDVVSELQGYRLLSDLYQSQDWDVMGSAYEQYTATYLKRQKGQFFTNRLITDLMAAVIDPDYEDVILDPAGGSGGFLTSCMRYIRRKILSRAGTTTSKQRQLDQHRHRLFMIDISKRLVKIAKTAMILNGDGHAGMTHGDSLGPYAKLEEIIRAKCARGMPTIILTNPPFAGVGEGRISDRKVLDNFSCGMKWTERDGKLTRTDEIVDEGVPPELLFFERCLDWIAPGGTIGIVMPKGFLDTQTYVSARKLMLDNYQLRAVVNCHKNTFQPHTGVRTCLVFVSRPKKGTSVPKDYPIFLAVSRKIGQDSEGVPIFQRNDKNEVTDRLDHDLDEILTDWRAFKKDELKASEYRFSIKRSDIDSQLRINPQFYLPNLNKTLRDIEQIDGYEGWSVVSVSELEPGVEVFKGPRIKTESLIVEEQRAGVENYYTPSSVLQEKSDSLKLLDVGRATTAQLRGIKKLRVARGDLLITRSGTIGRVAIVTSRLHGAIVSDDMIRVRVPTERIRLYTYAFLQTPEGLNQMLKNEYGSIQQHLEPHHVKGILLPVPPDWAQLKDLLAAVKNAVRRREVFEASFSEAMADSEQEVKALIARARAKGSAV